jgi:hypothetical protein
VADVCGCGWGACTIQFPAWVMCLVRHFGSVCGDCVCASVCACVRFSVCAAHGRHVTIGRDSLTRVLCAVLDTERVSATTAVHCIRILRRLWGVGESGGGTRHRDPPPHPFIPSPLHPFTPSPLHPLTPVPFIPHSFGGVHRKHPLPGVPSTLAPAHIYPLLSVLWLWLCCQVVRQVRLGIWWLGLLTRGLPDVEARTTSCPV